MGKKPEKIKEAAPDPVRTLEGPHGWKITVRATAECYLITGSRGGHQAFVTDTDDPEKVQAHVDAMRKKIRAESDSISDKTKVLKALK